jgi:DNA replication and repair protein RecF
VTGSRGWDSAAPTMALDRILLADYRNHADTRLDGTRQFNLLIGENGAGKTNVIEALSLLAPGRGLRRAALIDLAGQAGAGGFAVSAQLALGENSVALGTAARADRPSRRIVQINSAETSAVSLAEWLSIGWLTPAMDRLFAESPGGRRRFIDRMALALEPGHAANAARYEAALRERNRLISAEMEPDPRWLDAVEAQLAPLGAALAAARERRGGKQIKRC